MSIKNHPNFHAVKFVTEIMSAYYASLRGDVVSIDNCPSIGELVVEFANEVEKIVDDCADEQVKNNPT